MIEVISCRGHNEDQTSDIGSMRGLQHIVRLYIEALCLTRHVCQLLFCQSSVEGVLAEHHNTLQQPAEASESNTRPYFLKHFRLFWSRDPTPASKLGCT